MTRDKSMFASYNRVAKKMRNRDSKFFDKFAVPYIYHLSRGDTKHLLSPAIDVLNIFFSIYSIDTLDARRRFSDIFTKAPFTSEEYANKLRKQVNGGSSWFVAVAKLSEILANINHSYPHYSPTNSSTLHMMIQLLNNTLRATVMASDDLILMYNFDGLISELGVKGWRHEKLLEKVKEIRIKGETLMEENSGKLGMVSGGFSCEC